MNKLFLIPAFILVALASCQHQPDPKDLKTEYREYLLLAKNPPKHFYVDLLDTKTGDKYIRTYVSKHCNNHKTGAIVGHLYKLKRIEWTEGGNTYSKFANLYECFCQ